uniref:PB1 domain-containing protein n=1 Tax=Noccaea caerulescens TaxID=107243 RepID=A0A1J3G4T6_NOCCA
MASPNPTTVKFLCSYGGRITPRYPDGKLRYQGGHTRVLSVSRSISFTELERKIGEICGMKVNIRCQLPTDDLDALVTVSSDEDLTNLMEEYDMVTTAPLLKIRAFLTPPKSKTSSPPLSTASSSSSSSSSSKSSSRSRSPSSPSSKPENCSVCVERSIRNNGGYVHRSPSQNQFYQIHY